MMKQTNLILCAAAMAVALPGTLALSQSGTQDPNRAGQSQQDNRGQGSGQAANRGQERQTGQQPQQPGQAREQMSPEQQKQMVERWFKHAASGNQFEIESGRLASERAQNPQIKQHAQSIVQDHQQANQTLRQQAQQAGVQISETPELSAVHRAKLDELREKQGSEFERAWVFGQIAGHTHAILEYSWAAERGPQELQQYARQTLPNLQRHAQMIAPMAYQMAGVEGARTAGERMGGEGGMERDGANRDGMDRSGTGGTDRGTGGTDRSGTGGRSGGGAGGTGGGTGGSGGASGGGTGGGAGGTGGGGGGGGR